MVRRRWCRGESKRQEWQRTGVQHLRRPSQPVACHLLLAESFHATQDVWCDFGHARGQDCVFVHGGLPRWNPKRRPRRSG